MKLTEVEALQAYARMINTLDATHIEPLLADDFHYASQWVFSEIKSKQEFMDYIKPKLEAIRNSGAIAYAEMGELETDWSGPCVVMAQGSKDNLVSIVIAQVRDGCIKRLDMCIAPPPSAASRSEEYPAS